MKWLKGKSVFAVFMLGMIVACKPSIPRKYIQPDKMEKILYDYHLAQGIAQSHGTI